MNTTPLIHELQIEGKLNTALQTSQRADFALWLSMLSPKTEEFSVFQLEADDIDCARIDEEGLKKQLGVSAEHRLNADDDYFAKANEFSNALHNAGLASNKLSVYLVKDVLSQYNDAKKLDDNVLMNCPSHTQRLLMAEQTSIKVESDITQLKEVAEAAQAYAA